MGCNQSKSNKVETSNEDDITPKIYQSTNYNSTESSISEKKSGKTCNNYLLYGGESNCGGIILPYFTLGTSGFNLKPKGPQGPRALR